MSNSPLVSREDWTRARLELLAEEKAMNKALDALARKRRELPWVMVDKDYRFSSSGGEQSLVDLFAGHNQLVIYHFMYGPDWKQGCPSCSFWADNYNGIDIHLAYRGTRSQCIRQERRRWGGAQLFLLWPRTGYFQWCLSNFGHDAQGA